MEIKAELLKPYTDEQKLDFIVEQNHRQGYEIRETETALESWGYTEEEKQEQEKQQEQMLIKSQLAELDEKRIRAICENEIKDETTGETWVEYYNSQVIELRKQLNNL